VPVYVENKNVIAIGKPEFQLEEIKNISRVEFQENSK
jgi:hypothetical protein